MNEAENDDSEDVHQELSLKELIQYIAEALVDYPEQVEVKAMESENSVMLELKVAPKILDFEDWIVRQNLWVRRSNQIIDRVRAISVRPHQDAFLLTFENIEDRTAAEQLKAAEFCLPRAELPDLPEGWFWETDLIG